MPLPSPLITLTTDFGTRDSYVASMKGVILAICPQARMVDLSHDLPAGDIAEGAFFLGEALRHFPKDTIHIAVIDPGVGTDRRALAVRIGGRMVVCPDNGLLTLAARRENMEGAWSIENETFMRTPVSQTFHGRDVFAPAAAHLALGRDPSELGPKIHDEITKFSLPEAEPDGDGSIVAKIIHVDRFGNLITNIPREMVEDLSEVEILLGKTCIPGLSRTYSDGNENQALALIGSYDYLEIAVNGASAADLLEFGRGETVLLRG